MQQLGDTLHSDPHRRFNPLKGEWVLVSPQRNKRPWQGQTEGVQEAQRQHHDPNCYLCSGSERANGANNPVYSGPFVFTNDFPALLPISDTGFESDDPIFKHHAVHGEARVICYSERHDKPMARLSHAEISAIIRTWCDQHEELSSKYAWVQIFENKGHVMGCSNPHPHGQIWASSFVPTEIEREDRCQAEYYDSHGSALLIDYAAREIQQPERVVIETNDWICLVPFWATWPFETLLMPKQHRPRLGALTENERTDLAVALKELTSTYDRLFDVEFPYSMGWHGAPTNQGHPNHWQLHAHFYPPLLRSASVRKFMVGYEMLAEAQRDLTPEDAAKHLRDVATTI